MKLTRNIFLITTIVLSLSFFSCTVNETTGVITISNSSSSMSTGVRISGTSIASLGNGQTYDYWFYGDLMGSLSATGADFTFVAVGQDTDGSVLYDEVNSCSFKTGYMYTMEFISFYFPGDGYYQSQSIVVLYVNPGKKVSSDMNGEEAAHYPGQ